jgi:hypothetical protein
MTIKYWLVWFAYNLSIMAYAWVTGKFLFGVIK